MTDGIALDQLRDELEVLGYDTVNCSDTIVGLSDDDGAIYFSLEHAEGWFHLRHPIEGDFSQPHLTNSLLLANDRILGFRFSIDDEGWCFAVSDVLAEPDGVSNVIRTMENMIEVVPYYVAQFAEIWASGKMVTGSDLDSIADAIGGRSN